MRVTFVDVSLITEIFCASFNHSPDVLSVRNPCFSPLERALKYLPVPSKLPSNMSILPSDIFKPTRTYPFSTTILLFVFDDILTAGRFFKEGNGDEDVEMKGKASEEKEA